MTTEPFDDALIELERYELREGPAYHFDTDRREFVQVLGAGLLIAVSSSAARAQQRGRGRGFGRGRGGARAERVSDRFHIGEDGVVTVMTSKVEVGQGSRTQITQAAAEELRLPVEQIRVIMADTELCPDDGGTAGSRTTPSTVPQVRAAASAARELLLGLAADRLQADRSSIAIEDGAYVDRSSNKRLTLADLAKEEGFLSELDAAPPEGATIARVEEWTVLGKPVKKVNGEEVVTGAAKYPSDIRRDGQLYGKVLRPATYNATLQSIDLGPAQAMEGVTVVRDGDFVGCAARRSWEASQALEAIAATAQWDSPPHPSSDELFAHFKATAREQGSGGRGGRPNSWGNREAALADAAKKIDVAYTIAYIQHAPMEPRAAVAEWQDGKLTVWAGTQQPSRVRGQLVEAFRIPEEQVRVIVPDTGGGFGGKHTSEAAVEAARLAKAAGKPVSVRWTREEEFTWAYCRPGGLIEVQAGLDSEGKLHVWDFANYNSGGSAINTPYEVPHGRTRTISTDSPLRQGSYRALASTANTFARECAMDELAALAGADPYEFRLEYLPAGRLKDVLVAAAKKFDWSARRAKKELNRGVGIACGTEKGSFAAACVEVAVEDNRIKVLSVCQAYECGAIQNPANLLAQVEGCIIMGLGGALSEEMRFQDGKVTTTNFSSYSVPRMDDVPELDIVLLDRRDLDSVGAGETPIIAVAPAIGNAVFQATGKRIRSMPMRLAT